jgi:NADPH2:quinone reductase
MLAVKFYEFGTPKVLKIKDNNIKKIKDNEILIKVFSASINPVDAKTRQGVGFVAQSIKLPWIPGYDLSGEIIEIGNKVRKFKIGDKVFGMIGFPLKGGCYAEYAIANETEIAKIPVNVNLNDAAAIPLAALTAYQGIIKIGKLQPKETILIHAGAGGVGHFAIQFAKNIGAKIIATASNKNKKFLISLGADKIIDYEKEDFSKLSNIDFVYDLMGFDIGLKSISVLRKKGRIISVPTITADKVCSMANSKNIYASGMKVKQNINDLELIAKMFEDKKLNVVVSNYFELKDVKKAHTQIETGKTKGKIILTINN